MGELITVARKHPLYEKRKALAAQYGYEPPSSKVEAEDYKGKSGNMYEWTKEDLDSAYQKYKTDSGIGDLSDEDAQADYNKYLEKALSGETDFTYDFDTQEKADEFEASYQELLKETDAEKDFNLQLQNLPNYGRDWQPTDTLQEADYTKNENLNLYEPTAEQERPMTLTEAALAVSNLRSKAGEKKQTGWDKEEWLKSFGAGE